MSEFSEKWLKDEAYHWELSAAMTHADIEQWNEWSRILKEGLIYPATDEGVKL